MSCLSSIFPVQLPSRLASARTTNQPIRLLIELNGQPVAGTDELESRLREILKLGVQPPVIVDPEPTVAMADAIKVYDTARAAGADRVLFTANDES